MRNGNEHRPLRQIRQRVHIKNPLKRNYVCGTVLIFPSTWYEGMPMTIIESFALKTPVIASNLGAMKAMISVGENGLLFDPWLRVNVKQGAKIAGICFKSTTINDTISGWENRVGMRFPETGDYIIPKGLVPVKIDYPNNMGIYIEPNVWLYYFTVK